jgi:hypothetical protein
MHFMFIPGVIIRSRCGGVSIQRERESHSFTLIRRY